MIDVHPICVIYYLPDLFIKPVGTMLPVYEVNEMMRKILEGYHVLAVPSNQSADGSCEDVRLEVFHPKDFTDIQLNELKELVLSEINKLKP